MRNQQCALLHNDKKVFFDTGDFFFSYQTLGKKANKYGVPQI